MSASALVESRMRQHYQRLYNAKPTKEIARTRVPSAVGGGRKKSGGGGGGGSARASSAGTSGRRGAAGIIRISAAGAGTGVTGRLNRDKSTSNFELISRDVPGDYWTKLYISQDLQCGVGGGFSSDDDRLSTAADYRSSYTQVVMKAPPGILRASLNELSNTNNNSKNMSNKIDEFLSVVHRCEFELQEEFEMRKRRMSDARTRRMGGGTGTVSAASSARAWNRSLSSVSINTANSRRSTTFSNEPPRGAPRGNGSSKRSSANASKTSSVLTASKVYATGARPQQQPAFILKPPPHAYVLQQKHQQQQQRKVPRLRRPVSSQTFASSIRPLKAVQVVPEFPVPDTSKIESRLKQDRDHYQPPRRKGRPQTARKASANVRQINQKQNKVNGGGNNSLEYEDDFEDRGDDEAEDDGDGEDDDEEERDMLMTKQWLDDQAARGMARQRAMEMSKYRHDSHEKESSKDSAYGYSGGESRLQTREPTPDTWQMKQQAAAAAIANTRSFQMRRSRRQNDFHSNRDSTSQAEDTKSSAYVDFINRVTGDILKRGVFTDRAVREVLESHVSQYSSSSISKKEVEVLMGKLRRELGLKNGSSGVMALNGSLSDGNLRDMLYSTRRQEVKVDSSSRLCPGSASMRASSAATSRKKSVSAEAALDMDRISDQELSDILHDVDLDDSTVEEVIRTMRNRSNVVAFQTTTSSNEDRLRESPGNLRPLFDHLNITDLNISFNTKGEQAAKEKRTQQRALLIKSFAKNHQNSDSAGSGGGGGRSRPKSAAPGKKSSLAAGGMGNGGRKPSSFRPVSAGRQDSSSSNPDMAKAGPAVSSSCRTKSTGLRKKSAPAAASSNQSQMPDTPLHSSETPRSSSLYQPESEEEVNDEARRDSNRDASDISEDVDNSSSASDTDSGSVSGSAPEEVPDDDEDTGESGGGGGGSS